MRFPARRAIIIATFQACIYHSVCANQFSPTTLLPEAHYGHTLVSASGFLYNIGGLGGTNGVLTAQAVFYAPIQNSGSLGVWNQGTPLPEAVFFHSSVFSNNTVYVLGGFHFNNSGLAVSNIVYYSRLNADGSLGAWQTAAPLPQPAYFLSAAVWNGTIYVTGGSDGASLSNSVYSADIQSDGSLGPWKPQLSLPQGVYTHVAVSQGTLYVLGGVVNNGTQVQNTVYFARINPDKTLAGWNTTTPLPQPVSNHGAAVAAGQIWVTGGFTGSAPTNAAVSAAIASDGSLGAWSSFATLANPLYLHAETASDKFLFISGGTDGQNPQNAVYFMPLPPPPQPQDILPPRTTLTVGTPRYGSAPPFIAYATPLSLSAVDDALTVGDGQGVGVQSTQYAVDGTTFAVYQAPFAIGADGFHWVSFFSTDKVGNTETVQSSPVAVDGTPPVSSLVIGSPKAVLTAGGTVVSPQTQLSVTAIDPVVNGVASGVSQVLVGINSGTLAPATSGDFTLSPPDGAHTIRLQAIDNMQNVETLHQSILYLDGTPPVTTVQVAPAPFVGPNGTPILNAASLVSFDATDPVTGGVASGVHDTAYTLDGGPLTEVTGAFGFSEGAHILSYRSVDNVGNSEPMRSAIYWADLTPPQSTLSLSSPSMDFFGADVIGPQTLFTITAQDPVSNGVASGVARILFSVDGDPDQIYTGPFSLAGHLHTVSYGAIDNAGNAETRHSIQVNIGSLLTDALEAMDSVTLAGGAGVVGNVRANGAFEADGKASVTGNVIAMTASLTGKSAVTGTITQGQAPVPGTPIDLNAAKSWAKSNNQNSSIPGAFLSNGALVLDSHQQLTLPSGTYFLAGLTITGGATLSISGPVNLFVDGAVSVSGGGEINASGDANNLWIVTNGASANISGNARSALNLLAPLAAVSISGNGQFAGHILGDTVALSGKALQPSTSVLSAPTHGPAAQEHLAKHDPVSGAGTATKGQVNGLDQAVLSSQLEVVSPALAVVRHDGTAAPSQAPFTASSGASAAKGSVTAPFAMPPIDLSSHTAFSMVTSQGNTVRSQDHSGVVIPAGATASSLGVTVAPESAPGGLEQQRRDNAASAQALKSAGAGVEFGPEGTQFSKPVTIEVPYNRSLLPPGADETGLAVHYWNPGKGDWEALASNVDAQAQVVRAQTSHFSLYKVFSGAAVAAAPSAGGFGFGDVYAFPNPAHPGRNPTIHVEAGSADQVEIRIYDLSGELRHDVNLSGPQSAFEYTWDVGGAGSGIYIYVIKASKQGFGSIRTKGKLAVIK